MGCCAVLVIAGGAYLRIRSSRAHEAVAQLHTCHTGLTYLTVESGPPIAWATGDDLARFDGRPGDLEPIGDRRSRFVADDGDSVVVRTDMMSIPCGVM